MFPFQWPGKQSQEIIIHHPYIINLPLFNFFCDFCVTMMDANVSLITHLFIFLWMILTVTSIGYSWFLSLSDFIMLIQKFTINAWLRINAIVLLRLITWIKKNPADYELCLSDRVHVAIYLSLPKWQGRNTWYKFPIRELKTNIKKQINYRLFSFWFEVLLTYLNQRFWWAISLFCDWRQQRLYRPLLIWCHFHVIAHLCGQQRLGQWSR